MASQERTGSVFGLFDGSLGDRIERQLRGRDDVELIQTRAGSDAIKDIRTTDADLVLSAGYRHIIPENVIEETDARLVNAHISFLPYGKGANPNVWAIVDDDPAGVTLHEIVPEVDAGPIIAQRRVPKYPDDSGRDLYERLITSMDALILEWLPAILTGDYDVTPQTSAGSHHVSDGFDALCELDLDAEERVGDTIRKLRALTFEPYDNAYFEVDGQRYYVSIEVEADE